MLVSGLLLTASIPLSVIIMVSIIIKYPMCFKKYLWLFVYCFAMVVYCYSPTYENDLFRYYIEIEQCAQLPFSQAFTWADDGLFIKNFLFWVLAKIDQKNLLQAIAVGAMYGTTGYIVNDSISNPKQIAWIILPILGLLPLHLITNNIRNMLAFSLSIMGLYRDLVQKKRGVLTISLYILPCFIHMASLVMLLERVLLPFVKKHYKAGAALVLGIPILVENLYPVLKVLSIPGSIGKIVQRAIWKSYTTVTGTSAYAISTHESGYNNACRVIMFVFCFFMVLTCLHYIRDTKDKRDKYFDLIVFELMLCVFTCVYDLTGAVKYWVFAVAAVICGIPLLVQIINRDIRYSFIYIDARGMILLTAGARCVLEFYYMSSRIDFSELFYRLMSQNIFTVLFHTVRTII